MFKYLFGRPSNEDIEMVKSDVAVLVLLWVSYVQSYHEKWSFYQQNIFNWKKCNWIYQVEISLQSTVIVFISYYAFHPRKANITII